jgi:hypothetical protein
MNPQKQARERKKKNLHENPKEKDHVLLLLITDQLRKENEQTERMRSLLKEIVQQTPGFKSHQEQVPRISINR